LEEVTKNKDNSSDRLGFPTPPKHKNSEKVTDAFKTAYKQIRDSALLEKDQEAGLQDEIASNMDEPDTAAPAEEIETVSTLTIYQRLSLVVDLLSLTWESQESSCAIRKFASMTFRIGYHNSGVFTGEHSWRL